MKFIFDSAVTGVVDAIFIFVCTRLMSDVRILFKDSLWVSFISLSMSLIVSMLLGFVLSAYPTVTIILSALALWFLQVVILQLMAGTSAYKTVLPAKRAYFISLIAVLAQFFVASPLAYWLGPKIFG